MTKDERCELEILERRFPHIQEIHDGVLGMEIFSALAFGFVVLLLFGGHPWTWLSGFWRCVGAASVAHVGVVLSLRAAKEKEAIDRYFLLLDKKER